MLDMDLVPDDETGGFFFTWTIQNFSYCLQKKGEALQSPHFKLNMSDTNDWYLRIYPRGFDEVDTVGVFLFVQSSGPFPIEVNKSFSIRTLNGTFKRRKNEVASTTYEKSNGIGNACFLNHDELFKKKDDAFLENDTLTLRCRMWKDYPELPVSGQCYARTVINVKRITFDWTLENFKELIHNGKKTINFRVSPSQIHSYTADIFVSGEIYEKKIQVEIKLNQFYLKSFSTCKLTLLGADGQTDLSVGDDHWFEASNKTKNWHFTFMSVKKILDHEKLYLVNGELCLRCEFAVSPGEEYSEVEITMYGLPREHKAFSKTVDTSLPGSWKDDLKCFYNKGNLSDLTIRTASSKVFPVHKAILCARSKVFSAMFEHDTKENRTGVVEMKDLNVDTVSKMLLFTYTDIVVDLDWEAASELYFAADKYGIVALKRECSTFLKGNLNSSNVCEVLVLADMHQDQDMKSAAQEFLMDHVIEIVNSEYWKRILQEKPNLAAETLQVLLLKNLKV